MVKISKCRLENGTSIMARVEQENNFVLALLETINKRIKSGQS